jgi:putative tryptophan/tyrosine transport system substrate-binding protein
VKRRDFITLLGGATVNSPFAARAQQPSNMRHVGVLMPLAAQDPEAQVRVAAFERGVQQSGWTIGRNLQVDYRFAGGNTDQIRTYAAELVALAPDVILASTAVTLLPLQRATRTIPIVFVQIYDPVAAGFVANLARPDGNITGFTLGEFSLGGKMLELLKTIAPRIDHTAIMLNPDQPPHVAMMHAIEAAAPALGIRSSSISVRASGEIESAIETAAREPNNSLVALPNPLTVTHREQIAALAARHGIPAVYGMREFVVSGGLVSYGIDAVDQFRQATVYIDRILKGAAMAELPVQQPTHYQLVINLKTAKALGLTVPDKLLALADEVIE